MTPDQEANLMRTVWPHCRMDLWPDSHTDLVI